MRTLAHYKLERLLADKEPADYEDLDGALGALLVVVVLGLALYVAGVLTLLVLGQ